jgi:hypothetical protein
MRRARGKNSQDFCPKYCQEFGLWIARLKLARDENPRLLERKHLRIQAKGPEARYHIANISLGS